MSQARSLPYRREIDGLRALAVIAVVLFHAELGGFQGGFVGVDVFFVISGYLITRLLIAEHEAGVFSLRSFYERRARRLLPALFVVLAVSTLAAVAWLGPERLSGYSRALVAVPLFVSNFHFWLNSGYFAPAAELEPLLHTWSLAVEEQYYLLFPLLFSVLWRRGRFWVFAILGAVAIVGFAVSDWGTRHASDASFYLLHTRSWELLLGALVVALQRFVPGFGALPSPLRQGAALAGVAAIALAVSCYGDQTPFPGRFALLPTLGSALLLAFADRSTWVGRGLAWWPLVWVGLISYSAYLWHQPIFAFARLLAGGRPSSASMLALAALSFLLSYVTWRFVEQPFRSRRFLPRRTIFAGALLGSVLFVGVGLWGAATSGLPSRLTEGQQRLLQSMASSPRRDACHTRGEDYLPPREACRYFGKRIRWAVLGDSHAVELGYVLARRVAPRDVGILHLTFSGCPPALTFDVAEPGCARWTSEAVAEIERHPEIRNVVVAYRHSAYLFGETRGIAPRLPKQAPVVIGRGSPTRLRERYWESFEAMLERLEDGGKRVFVVAPIPELSMPIDSIALSTEGRSDVPGLSLEYYRTRNSFVLAHLADMPYNEGRRRLEPARALCRLSTCYAVLGGQALYFDDHHLSLAGAGRVLTMALPE